MATKYLTIEGKVRWAKVYDPDEAFGDTRWILDLYPSNEKEWAKFNSSGLELKVKEDKEGEKYFTLRRQIKRLFYGDDEVTFFTPPEISGAVNVRYVDENTGQKFKGNSYKKSSGAKVKIIGDKVLIGNGSLCEVQFSVYDTQKGKGHRLDGLKVVDFVAVPDRNDEPDYSDDDETEPVVAVVPEVKTKKETKPSVVAKDMNDSVPW